MNGGKNEKKAESKKRESSGGGPVQANKSLSLL
jgi:hypothetical protein